MCLQSAELVPITDTSQAKFIKWGGSLRSLIEPDIGNRNVSLELSADRDDSNTAKTRCIEGAFRSMGNKSGKRKLDDRPLSRGGEALSVRFPGTMDIRSAQVQVVDLIVPQNVQPDPGPVSSVNFTARITKIECDLKKASVVREADGGISKCGDAMLRTMLYEAAQSMLTHSKKWSWLKAWAMRVAQRGGMRRATVALARRIAVILHRMWIDGTDFRFSDLRCTLHQ